nr:acyltransferase [uncultured Cellulosilyticum sp.]
MKEREYNLDLLRIIAALFVIIIHVIVRPLVISFEQPYHSIDFLICSGIKGFVQTAVPIFVLLSGAFILTQNKNKNFSYFYKKTFTKIILPTLIAAIIYYYFSLVLQVIKDHLGNTISSTAYNWLPIKILFASPFYHLWYMYMLIGLYLAVPLLIKLKERLGEKWFFIIGIMLLIMAIFIEPYNRSIWPIRFINYLGYFILGHSIHYYKDYFRAKWLFLSTYLIASILATIMTYFIVIHHTFSDINKSLMFYDNLSPFMIVSSLSLYLFFLNLPSKRSKIHRFTKHTFNIYILHAGILMLIDQTLNNILHISINVIIYIPLLSLIIFILSYIGSLLLNKLIYKFQALRFIHIHSVR